MRELGLGVWGGERWEREGKGGGRERERINI
jgi:hypothetical protein